MKIMKQLLLLVYLTCISHAQSRVTIITPIVSDDPIHDFIQLLIEQCYFDDIDLIFIGNKIDDHDLCIIHEYQSIFFNIQAIIGNKQEPLGKLFNQALEQCKTPFITLMRVEDYRDPQLFLAQLDALEKDSTIDIVYADYYTSYSPNTPTENADNWYLNELPEFSPQLLYRDIPGPHAMWRKSLHTKYGLVKDDFHFWFLWEFWNRCAYEGVLFKKIKGKPSTFHFNYFNQKKILFGPDDFSQSYCEEEYIRNKYSALWSSVPHTEKPFVIVTASYKNKDWYKRNLDSVLFQNYSNYRIIYIDDNSPDDTGKLVQEYCQLLHKEDKIRVIVNQENVGALANIYNAIHSCKPEEIIILLDGDDSLAHNDVLKHLNRIYQDNNVWLTYGQFQWFPAQIPGFTFEMPQWVIEKNCIREYRWVTTHLRSFYASLFHKIKKEDLLYQNKFYSMAWDLAIMYPMVEMAGYHTRFIPEILYIYNTANQINDSKVNLELQGTLDSHIRNKQRYTPITNCYN